MESSGRSGPRRSRRAMAAPTATTAVTPTGASHHTQKGASESDTARTTALTAAAYGARGRPVGSGQAHPLLAAVPELLVFPDRHGRLEGVDQVAAGLERLAPMGRGDRYDDREVAHREVPDAVHGRDGADRMPGRNFSSDVPQPLLHRRVRRVGQRLDLALVVDVADGADEQAGPSRPRVVSLRRHALTCTASPDAGVVARSPPSRPGPRPPPRRRAPRPCGPAGATPGRGGRGPAPAARRGRSRCRSRASSRARATAARTPPRGRRRTPGPWLERAARRPGAAAPPCRTPGRPGARPGAALRAARRPPAPGNLRTPR